MENKMMFVVAIVVSVAIVGGSYYYKMQGEQQAPSVEAPAPEPEIEPETKAEPEIKYPIQAPEPETAKPLPALEDSDKTAQDAFAGVVGKESVKRFFEVENLVRRVVVTIDNLPRKKLPQQYNIAKPVEGKFLAAGKDDSLALNYENHRRYASYVALAEKIDAKKLVAVYKRFYPLLQEEFRNLGSPKQYFNDRVVEAIDDLLAAPDPKGVVKLVQPKVFYQFADPELEALSAGQKMMIRMGGENAARVKAKLQEIRRELTGVKQGG